MVRRERVLGGGGMIDEVYVYGVLDSGCLLGRSGDFVFAFFLFLGGFSLSLALGME